MLQYEILSWLKVVQTDLVLGDDDVVSALLRLPSFEKAQMRQANMLSGSTAHRDILRHNFRQSAMRRSSVAVGRLGVHDTYFVVEAEKENILRGYSDDSVDMAAPLTTDKKQEQQTVSVPDFFPDGEELEVVSEDGTWSGTDMHNFQWIGMSPAIRAMYTDCSYNHNFRVRGLTYMSDKKKVKLCVGNSTLLTYTVGGCRSLHFALHLHGYVPSRCVQVRRSPRPCVFHRAGKTASTGVDGVA